MEIDRRVVPKFENGLRIPLVVGVNDCLFGPPKGRSERNERKEGIPVGVGVLGVTRLSEGIEDETR